MRTRTAYALSAAAAAAGIAAGLWGLSAIDPLVMRGGFTSAGPVVAPNLAPLIAIIAAVVFEIVALLVPMLRTRQRPHRVAEAAANATPLIVTESANEVTFIWGEPRSTGRGADAGYALTAA
ncbi:hypothetical protein GCM10011490_15710 [Pseudoclavibacter endophyticus]|uniref:Uncharacterized protein n=1 Tax=Pseudoclavibacter endophyticus TaxID=1778590 RepID=A0A6H9WDP6_9MICO|nr:hypothetical protein [Pseudoclavibacter endophyticus]KAB1649049.1 hypothetical protein F8O04_01825 [Pseudoclavibacter endophyticus]GGA65906.1 hypothetical protein GCM10011490_15710 [Pseudoclavibacter endophyticus]